MQALLSIGLCNALAAVVLALVAIAVDRVFRRPALSHWFWLLVLLKLVTPPLVHVPLPRLAEPAQPLTVLPQALPDREKSPGPMSRETAVVAAPRSVVPSVEETMVPPRPLPEISLASVALAVWLGGSFLWWTTAAVRMARFSWLLRQTEPAPAELRERIRQLAHLLGLRRAPSAAIVPGVVSPLLWAPGWSAHILLPKELWERLDEDQRDSLLVHELAHLQRGDQWVRRLELVALGLYWWHPVAWWARRELQDAEERCCDALVLRALPGSAAVYAGALVETVAFLSASRTALPFGASGGGQARQLTRRVTMILQGRTARPLGGLALLGVLGIGAVLLALAPGGGAEPPGSSSGATENAAAEPPLVVQVQPVERKRIRVEEEEWLSAVRRRPVPEAKNPIKAAQEFLTGLQEVEHEKAANAMRAQSTQELRDEIELLEAKLLVNRAQVEAAKAGLQAALEKHDRVRNLPKAVNDNALSEAKSEVRARQAEVAVKEAETREPRVRLMQARRRLAALEGKKEKKQAAPADSPRLQEMERKVDELRREIESLRKERGRSSSARPMAPWKGMVVYTQQEALVIPCSISDERRAQSSEIQLLRSVDEGKHWELCGRTEDTGLDRFQVLAPRNGRFRYQFRTVDREGKLALVDNPISVVFDTEKPEIEFETSNANDELTLDWKIKEENPDLTSFLLEYRLDGQWKRLDVQPALTGHRVLKPGTTAVRLRIRDLAGNETTGVVNPLP